MQKDWPFSGMITGRNTRFIRFRTIRKYVKVQKFTWQVPTGQTSGLPTGLGGGLLNEVKERGGADDVPLTGNRPFCRPINANRVEDQHHLRTDAVIRSMNDSPGEVTLGE